MLENLKYKLPDGCDVRQIFRKLAVQYSLKKESMITKKFSFFDTFDWRLFNKSLVLFASENRLFLRKLAKHKNMFWLESSSPPGFIWEFPDGALKRYLAPIIKMRALLKLTEVQSRSTPYRILNRDEKTVARLVLEDLLSSGGKDGPSLGTHLWLRPVKGYPKYARTLVEWLAEAGLTVSAKEDIFSKALEIENKNPGSYSAKVNIQLAPDMRSDEAARLILRFLLDVIRINETHIEKDLDTEFVHDYRVAIRRTRSALGQISYVFPTKTTDRFKKDFAFVGKLSNDLRDLDVYLLNENSYKAMIPPVLRDDISPLFDHLRKKRAKALQKVINGLKSKKYEKILKDWEAFLNQPPQDDSTAPNAELPIVALASKRIYKKYRRIVNDGNLILENAEDEMLHALRIHCKKLRYLMEFFSSLFSRKKIKVLIAQLKKLQDNLGDFNDLCVQEEYLLNITKELPATQRQLKKTLVAIGSLVGSLARERQMVKDAFAETFTDFASAGNKKLFQELFVSKAKEKA